MACGSTHELAGAAAGIAISSFDKGEAPIYVKNPLTAGLIGALAGKLPDMIEPARHPNHRQFFHSVVFFALIARGVHWLYKWSPEEEWQQALRHIGLVAGAGYLSHLVFDAITPKSLPIL